MSPKQEECLDIYRLHAEFVDRLRDRRERVFRIFVTLFTVLFAAFIASARTVPSAELNSIKLIIGIPGLALSLSWYVLIDSYQKLEKVKLEVIKKLEEHLVFPFLTQERESLKKTKNRFVYNKLDNAETLPSFVFGALSVALIILWGLSEAGLSL